ncbi:MAG: tetratricopeptide repeat protein [Proteobacteria bacterium]|nr:tetratricopeptide repeat protein [Pseudomonadota bacterium]
MTDQSASPPPKIRLAACLVVAGFLFAVPAEAQNRQQQQATQTQADAQQDRIEELQRQLTVSTAENENLQHQLMDAQREITRLRAMVGNLAQVNQDVVAGMQNPNAPPPAQAQAPDTGAPLATQGGAPGPRADASDSNGAADAGGKLLPPGAQGQLGTLAESALPPVPTPTPEDAYANARSALVAGQYAEAETAFGDYLEHFPNADNAADARFWFAFTQLARNNYQDAAANFVRYLQAAPNAPRAPEAQVRLGMALAGLGQTRQACGAYANLPRRYPNAPRNIRDLATREARASACPTT